MELSATVKSSRQVKSLEKRIVSLKRKNMKKIVEKFQRNIKHDQYPSLKAFVLFDSMGVRNKVLQVFRN